MAQELCIVVFVVVVVGVRYIVVIVAVVFVIELSMGLYLSSNRFI